jgi:3-oxo-5-alpha-steroid 4-dehydrogenase 1
MAKPKLRRSRSTSSPRKSTKQNPGVDKLQPKAPAKAVPLFVRCSLFKLTGDEGFDFWVSVSAYLVCVCAIAEQVQSTGYGRFGGTVSAGLDPRIGWWLMELPCTLSFAYNFFVIGGKQSKEFVPRLMAFIFLCHYVYRGWYWPLNIKVHGNTKNFDMHVAFSSWIVTTLHGFLSARWFAHYGEHLKASFAQSPRIWLGLVVYYSGLVMVIWHDNILRDLRSGDGPRYRIPKGGLFEYATCPQYFAELWAWLGFAILSWGPNGLFIFMVSLVNLVPRSMATHAWYVEKFGLEYPADRAFLVPFVF